VPAATALGQHLGWRATFVVVSVIGLVALASLALLVPALPEEPQAGVAQEIRALREPQVLLGLLTAVFGFAGVFAVYSYLASMMTKVTGFADGSVTVLLALFGIGMTLGALAAGPLTDRALRPTLYGSLGALAVVLVAFHYLAQSKATAPVGVVLLGAIGFLTTTPLQMLVMNKARRAPTLASASNHSAFNLANAGGAWLGGLVISAGWGWAAPTLVGAALAVAGLGLAFTGGVMDRGGRRSKVITQGTPAAEQETPVPTAD
jgi:DHA1 family inner membrane transport protein